MTVEFLHVMVDENTGSQRSRRWREQFAVPRVGEYVVEENDGVQKWYVVSHVSHFKGKIPVVITKFDVTATLIAKGHQRGV